MTRVLGLDIETSGLNKDTDRIIEFGCVLWEVESKKPLLIHSSILKEKDCPYVTPEITKLTGISESMLTEFGADPSVYLHLIGGICKAHDVKYLVAHNGKNFDYPFLIECLKRNGRSDSPLVSLPLIDTRWDLPFKEEPESRKLKHLAPDHGFINPFSHRAVFDVLTMLRIMSFYDFNEVVALSKIPFITVKAEVSYDNREKAKAQKYIWEKAGDKVYPKSWVKLLRENEWDAEVKKCDFPVVRLV